MPTISRCFRHSFETRCHLVDSGPGRVNTEMLAQLRRKGFYLIPDVPNTTHVTQETDISYGQFKLVSRDNLNTLTDHRINIKRTIQPTDIPLLILGCEDNGIKLKNAFEAAFGFETNKKI